MKPEQELQNLSNYQKVVNKNITAKAETWMQEACKKNIIYLRNIINKAITEHQQDRLPIQDIATLNSLIYKYLDHYRESIDSLLNFREKESQFEFEESLNTFQELEFCVVQLEIGGLLSDINLETNKKEKK